MLKRLMPPLMICLLAASAAHAQYGGGGMGGGGIGGGMGGGGMGGMGGGDGGGGRGHGGGGHGRGGHAPAAEAEPAKPEKPFTEPEIIGVVKTIDLQTGRVTIAYDAVEALGWPAGTQPFSASKTSLLKDLAVGEKVRFRLESQQIATIGAF